MLGQVAYATNGKEIVEFDYFTGVESAQASYATPAALWERYRTGARIKDQATAERLLTPFNHDVCKGERCLVNEVAEKVVRLRAII